MPLELKYPKFTNAPLLLTNHPNQQSINKIIILKTMLETSHHSFYLPSHQLISQQVIMGQQHSNQCKFHLHSNIQKSHFALRNQSISIVGGGPVGIFLACHLLNEFGNVKVTVYEQREILRPQVVNIAFRAIDSLPEEIKRSIWPNATVYDKLFGEQTIKDNQFWPYPSFQYQPHLCLSNFQSKIKAYIETHFKSNFEYVNRKMKVEDIINLRKNSDVVFVASGLGKLVCSLRNELGLSKQIANDAFTRTRGNQIGMYLVYKAKGYQDYQRNEDCLRPSQMMKRGLSYLASNNSQLHTQIYIFPEGPMQSILASIPQALIHSLQFGAQHTINFSNYSHKLSDKQEQQWLENFICHLKSEAKYFGIPLPSDDQIQVYCAFRRQLAYELPVCSRENEAPLLLVGDSAGMGDFRLGLNLGRGLLCCLFIINQLKLSGCVKKTQEEYQKHWLQIIDSQFNKNNLFLVQKPQINLKYRVEGRKVDGKVWGTDLGLGVNLVAMEGKVGAEWLKGACDEYRL